MVTLLSIIILSFNTKTLTIKCLQSLIRRYKKELENKEFEIIVVDNGSSDNTVATIQQFNHRLSGIPQWRDNSTINKIKVIKNEKNYGFSKGNNIGAEEAKGRYLFFLNSDTQIKDKGLLGMVNFLDSHKNIGILGGGLEAGKFYNLFNVFLMLIGGERLGLDRFSPKKEAPVDWVSGASFMIRKDLFSKLGGFDENLFMYMEDVEICFRAKKRGALTYFYPKLAIVHKRQGSGNREFAILNIYKGLLYFYKKHSSPMQYLIVKSLLTIKAYIAIAIGEILENRNLASTYRKAITML